ncbi:hypothetical protein GDO86_008351 [Hymenochirus boettgeri]|uniref:Myb-like domain-containing protein n=1 Tax=Hymenochirus boettgeri TaxID=247094 RepID=A0A8T2IXC1_9PIPI|nr:hypothetical protein GDO86_008351 [Hymenochirus boettgeri]
MRTDLNLLLDCLKCQMNSPKSQKEALFAICSICQKNRNESDYFREIGGLTFVTILAKSTPHAIVKEECFLTMGILAEKSVFCQQTLCTSEIFEDIYSVLAKEESPVKLKRTSLYVFSVLVSNNKILSPYNLDLYDENIHLSYQLWTSVCRGLCACANNPQNDENQELCSSVFPQAKEWLQHSVTPEIVSPVCSLISLIVANNSSTLEYFASVGGLHTLAAVFLQLVSDAHIRIESFKLAVKVTKTIDACIANNFPFSSVLSKYNIVSNLLTLLRLHTLDLEDKLCIVLTLGHATENCEENQYELLKGNGFHFMIQVFTDDSQNEELCNAATFVLQNCRHIRCLAVGTAMNSRNCYKILHDSSYLCNHHMVIIQTEERYKRELKKLLYRTAKTLRVLDTKKWTQKGSNTTSTDKATSVLLSVFLKFYSQSHYENGGLEKNKRRSRRNFSQSEVSYLLDGVQKFSRNWNTILWSYPFLKGRTNVDLSNKYKQLQKEFHPNIPK